MVGVSSSRNDGFEYCAARTNSGAEQTGPNGRNKLGTTAFFLLTNSGMGDLLIIHKTPFHCYLYSLAQLARNPAAVNPFNK
jgi:hypothetical protein